MKGECCVTVEVFRLDLGSCGECGEIRSDMARDEGGGMKKRGSIAGCQWLWEVMSSTCC